MPEDDTEDSTLLVSTESKGKVYLTFTGKDPTNMDTVERGRYIGQILDILSVLQYRTLDDDADVDAIYKLYFFIVDALKLPNSYKDDDQINGEMSSILHIAEYSEDELFDIIALTRYRLSLIAKEQGNFLAMLEYGYSKNCLYICPNERFVSG